MAQVSKYPLSIDVYDQIEVLFIDTLANLTDKKLTRSFLFDFLTPTEKIVLVKRLAIYILLGKGYRYEEIKKILHVSDPTIAGANTSYKYLGTGCKQVINKLIQDEKISLLFHSIALGITGEFARVRKGSGVWKYLHQQIKRSEKKKKF